MRRPSWNKSQAIQQVISLKTLLETTSDCGGGDAAGARKKLFVPPPENQHRVNCKPLIIYLFIYFYSFGIISDKLAAFFFLFFLKKKN